jgi:hypothetical protein
MKALMFDEKDAKDLYPTASPVEKRALENTFGKNFFSQKIEDRIQSIEDVCQILGVDPEDAWDEDIDTPDEIAYKQMKLITRAYNQGWVPDFNNTSQPKWHAWWYLNNPGFRLGGAVSPGTSTLVGARLEFQHESHAKDAAEKFKPVYEVFFKLK